MKKIIFMAIVLVAATGCKKAQTPGLTNGKVDYPTGYRSWTHVKSMVIQEGHSLYGPFGGIHHIYANDLAIEALKKKQKYPDGSYFVFDLIDVNADGSAITEKDRKITGVMYKDANKFKDTGGWAFEGFKGNTRERAITDGGKSCFACHAGLKSSDFVYSEYRK